MSAPIRPVSRAVLRFIALAAAALAQGALADEGGPGAADPAVPSYLDAARLPHVEEAYKARAARSDSEKSREAEASAQPSSGVEDREPETVRDAPRKIERARRLAATVRERVERFGPLVRSDEPVDAAGWAMHADEIPNDGAGATGKALEARLEAAERRATEAEARLAAEAAARRRAEKAAAAAAEKAAEAPRSPRQGKREQTERRGDDPPKPAARENRRGSRSQAERDPAAPRRNGEKRAAAEEPARQRVEKVPARAPPPPPDMDPPPPPPRASGLFGLFAPSAPEPPPPESGRPDIPNEIRSRGWY